MTCEELPDWLDELCDGAASLEAVEHVQGCAECQADLAVWKRLRQAMREMPVPTLPAGLDDDILTALDHSISMEAELPTALPETKRGRGGVVPGSWWRAIGALAAMLVVAVGVKVFNSSLGSELPETRAKAQPVQPARAAETVRVEPPMPVAPTAISAVPMAQVDSQRGQVNAEGVPAVAKVAGLPDSQAAGITAAGRTPRRALDELMPPMGQAAGRSVPASVFPVGQAMPSQVPLAKTGVRADSMIREDSITRASTGQIDGGKGKAGNPQAKGGDNRLENQELRQNKVLERQERKLEKLENRKHAPGGRVKGQN